MNIPRHNTPRLILRRFEPADIDLLYKIVSDPDVIRYFPLSNPWPREVTQKWVEKHWSHWEQHNFGWWAIVYRETNDLLGWCGLGVLEETGEVEVLYLLKKSHWGMGLATEAAQYSIDYAFQELNLDSVIGLTRSNRSSVSAAPADAQVNAATARKRIRSRMKPGSKRRGGQVADGSPI